MLTVAVNGKETSRIESAFVNVNRIRTARAANDGVCAMASVDCRVCE